MYEKRVESYALHIPQKRQLKPFLFHFTFKLKAYNFQIHLIVVSRLVISSEIVHSNQVPQCPSKRLGQFICSHGAEKTIVTGIALEYHSILGYHIPRLVCPALVRQ